MEQDMKGMCTGYVEWVDEESEPAKMGLCAGARLLTRPENPNESFGSGRTFAPNEFLKKIVLEQAWDASGAREVKLLFQRSQGVSITGRNLKFRYPTRKETMVLNDTSFHINAGEKVAFVGGSGSGKSTIIQLVQSFYQPEFGALLFNGYPLADLLLQDLRHHMTIVSQEPILFQMSLRDNLCLGLGPRSQWPSDAEIMKVCKKACIDSVVNRLPEGLNTFPGSGGSQFSGGQKQRFAIARALLKKPTVLLLDEATSALDYESEKQVQEAIDNLGQPDDESHSDVRKPLTMIVVAHRLSTVRNADKIYVLDKGRIIEWGSHDELNKIEDGWYAGMCNAQAKKPELVDQEHLVKRSMLADKSLAVVRARSVVSMMQDGIKKELDAGDTGDGGIADFVPITRASKSYNVTRGSRIQNLRASAIQQTGAMGMSLGRPSVANVRASMVRVDEDAEMKQDGNLNVDPATKTPSTYRQSAALQSPYDDAPISAAPSLHVQTTTAASPHLSSIFGAGGADGVMDFAGMWHATDYNGARRSGRSIHASPLAPDSDRHMEHLEKALASATASTQDVLTLGNRVSAAFTYGSDIHDHTGTATGMIASVNSGIEADNENVQTVSNTKMFWQLIESYNTFAELNILCYPSFAMAVILGLLKPMAFLLIIQVIQLATTFEEALRSSKYVGLGIIDEENNVEAGLSVSKSKIFKTLRSDIPAVQELRAGMEFTVKGYFVLGVVCTICTGLMDVWMSRLSAMATARLRAKLMQSILSQDILWFDMPENSNDNLAKLLREGCVMTISFYSCIRDQVEDSIYAMVSMLVCLYINPYLSLALLGVMTGAMLLVSAQRDAGSDGDDKKEKKKKKRKRSSDGSIGIPQVPSEDGAEKPKMTSHPLLDAPKVDGNEGGAIVELANRFADGESEDSDDEDDGGPASSRWITEGTLYIRTVRAMNGCEMFYQNLKKSITQEEAQADGDHWANALANGYTAAAIGFVFIMVYIIGVALMILGLVKGIGDIMGILCAMMGVANKMNSILETRRTMPRIKVMYLEILKVLNRCPLVDYADDDEEGLALTRHKDLYVRQAVRHFHRLEFKQVHFAYPSRPMDAILRGLSITIDRGDQVALCGPSGSGKSTVMQQLMRFYDPNICVPELYKRVQVELRYDPELRHEPEASRCLRYLMFDTAGQVFVTAETTSASEELALRDHVDLRTWREVIGYVGQEPILFDMSAKDNILWGLHEDQRENVSYDDILEVARKANVDFIGPGAKFDWDTPLGPRAGKISGGQRQRLAIARALIRKPQILLLDEATSALDNHSQREVQAALDQLIEEEKGNLTTITIAHRLSTIRNCNKIMVLVDGTLKEQGNWNELVAIEDGIFKGLVDKSQEQ